MTYEVKIAPLALEKLYEQAVYIANEQGAPETAVRWLQRILQAGESLADMPRRCAWAPEDSSCPYEVRSMTIGQFMLLFTILEETKTVWIVNARHARQLPQPGDTLPELDSLENEE